MLKSQGLHKSFISILLVSLQLVQAVGSYELQVKQERSHSTQSLLLFVIKKPFATLHSPQVLFLNKYFSIDVSLQTVNLVGF